MRQAVINEIDHDIDNLSANLNSDKRLMGAEPVTAPNIHKSREQQASHGSGRNILDFD